MKTLLILLSVVGLAGLATGCQPAEEKTITMKNAEPQPAATVSTSAPPAPPAQAKITKADSEWRTLLSPEQYRVLRQAGTERPFGAAYEEFKSQGSGKYVCAGCGALLFSSKEKFDSHCGWPSFYDPANATNVVLHEDRTMGMVRVEVTCAQCGGHLGHVFKGEGFDTPTDQRFCINHVSLKFVPDEKPKTAQP